MAVAAAVADAETTDEGVAVEMWRRSAEKQRHRHSQLACLVEWRRRRAVATTCAWNLILEGTGGARARSPPAPPLPAATMSRRVRPSRRQRALNTALHRISASDHARLELANFAIHERRMNFNPLRGRAVKCYTLPSGSNLQF